MEKIYKSYYQKYLDGKMVSNVIRVHKDHDDESAFRTAVEFESKVSEAHDGRVKIILMYISVVDPDDKSHEMEIIYG